MGARARLLLRLCARRVKSKTCKWLAQFCLVFASARRRSASSSSTCIRARARKRIVRSLCCAPLCDDGGRSGRAAPPSPPVDAADLLSAGWPSPSPPPPLLLSSETILTARRAPISICTRPRDARARALARLRSNCRRLVARFLQQQDRSHKLEPASARAHARPRPQPPLNSRDTTATLRLPSSPPPAAAVEQTRKRAVG